MKQYKRKFINTSLKPAVVARRSKALSQIKVEIRSQVQIPLEAILRINTLTKKAVINTLWIPMEYALNLIWIQAQIRARPRAI